MDVCLRPATELLTMLRRREIGAHELLAHYLARIDRLDGPLNAVVTRDVERAYRAADEADAAIARGGPATALHGLPMTIKDTFEIAGVRTTAGHEPYAAYVPSTDAVAVARLRAAGAIPFARTNVPVLAGDIQTFNPIFGTTNNPWDATRTSGGSSGGAAVAVAMGFTGLELGSDIGGSIRTPSNWCGVYGHKPTFGIVPQRGHIPPAAGALIDCDLNVVGPIARSASDLRLAMDVLVGPLADVATAWRLALPPPRHGRLRDYRIAAWIDDPAFPVDPAVRERLEATLAALRAAGCRVDDAARPRLALGEAIRTYLQLLMPVIFFQSMAPDDFQRLTGVAATLAAGDESGFARTVRFGTESWFAWAHADEARQRVRAAFAEFFRSYDVLLLPTNVVPAIPHDHTEPLALRQITVGGTTTAYINLFGWIGLATMAWLPATVAPVGRTPTGLPVGIQIVGPYLEDYTTLDVAERLRDVIGGFEPPPAAK